MIQVISTVALRPDSRANFLLLLNENIPQVLAEEGCLAYKSMVDVESGIPTQIACRKDTVTLIEAWESMEALHAHLKVPHMTIFREAVKNLVFGVSHQVLKSV